MHAKKISVYILLNWLIAAVWLINGLFCKILDMVPRHRAIVAAILGTEHAAFFTKLIGWSEVAMAIWIVSRVWPRLNAIVQIAVIATMNILECILVPDLLLWGRMNGMFALLFIILIAYNSMALFRQSIQRHRNV